jgi:hypothetical protein
MELMDGDDWLKTVEKKLHVVQCNNREKVLLALHQLEAMHLIGGMHMLKHMKNPKASTGMSSRWLSNLIIYLKVLLTLRRSSSRI